MHVQTRASALHLHEKDARYCKRNHIKVYDLLTTLTLHHTFTVLFQAQNSPFHKSFPPQLATTHLDCLLGYILDRTYSAQRFFIFRLIFSFYFGSCGRLSWLNYQLSSAR